MTKRFVVVLAAVAMVALVAPPVQSAEFYAGAGVVTSSFSADLKAGKYFRLEDRIGFGLNAGYRLSRGIALDVTVTRTNMKDEFSGNDVIYTQQEFGPVFLFNITSNIRPFLEIGAGSYVLDFGDFQYDGKGAYLGAGLEEYSGVRHSVKIYARGKYWKGDPYELDAPVLCFGLIYNYHIGASNVSSSGGWIESVQ